MATPTGINPTTGQAIDVGLATQAANRLDHAHDVISGLKARLEGHQVALRANWVSKSAGRFSDVFNAFERDFQAQLNALADMHQKLIKSNAHYVNAVAEQGAIVNRVHDLINNTIDHSGTAQ